MGEPGWLCQLGIQLLILVQVMIPGSWDQAPWLGSALTGEPAKDSLSPSLPLPLSPARALSLSLSLSLKKKFFNVKRRNVVLHFALLSPKKERMREWQMEN